LGSEAAEAVVEGEREERWRGEAFEGSKRRRAMRLRRRYREDISGEVGFNGEKGRQCEERLTSNSVFLKSRSSILFRAVESRGENSNNERLFVCKLGNFGWGKVRQKRAAGGV